MTLKVMIEDDNAPDGVRELGGGEALALVAPNGVVYAVSLHDETGALVVNVHDASALALAVLTHGDTVIPTAVLVEPVYAKAVDPSLLN